MPIMEKNIHAGQPIVTSVLSYFYLFMGIILLGIGILGIFLPLLPTTIFLILASACFIKGSPKAHNWLINNRWLGGYIRNYKEKSGLTVKSKFTNVAALWISIAFSAFYFTNELYIRIILLIIAIGVTIHLASIKTLRNDSNKIGGTLHN